MEDDYLQWFAPHYPHSQFQVRDGSRLLIITGTQREAEDYVGRWKRIEPNREFRITPAYSFKW